MKTIKKSNLKEGYFWEFKPFYDSLPEKLKVPPYTEHILDTSMSNKEIMEKWEKKPFTVEQAFAVAADVVPTLENGKWRIVYFRDEGIPCRLYVWRRDAGRLRLSIGTVGPGRRWHAGDGVLVSNENSDSFPLNPDTLDLEALTLRVRTLEETVEKLTRVINIESL